ncbi:hypothetical protein KKB99_01495 [bacterium]|nr:hypothetical protein [bacterium]MBU1024660.1 hypothetical protein [bacterium]
MYKIKKANIEDDRRKARWELVLSPFVTTLVVAFCLGVLLVWIGMFENRVNPGDGVVMTFVSDLYKQIASYVSSLI